MHQFPQFGRLEHGHSPQKRISEVARSLRALSVQARNIPFDPKAAAHVLGLTVSDVDLPAGIYGRLVIHGQPPRIEVQRAQSFYRARFTIAHELGHLCFLDILPILPKERGDVTNAHIASIREERLCDQIAAELLMPRRPFERIAKLTEPSFDGVRQLQRTFCVSFAAILRRVTELRTWSVGRAEWEWNEGALICRKRQITKRRGSQSRTEADRLTGALFDILLQAERSVAAGSRSLLKPECIYNIRGHTLWLRSFKRSHAAVIHAFVV